MQRLILTLALLTGLALGAAHASEPKGSAAKPAPKPAGSAPKGSDTKPAVAAPPRVIGLLFYADWCATCKELEPKLSGVKPQLTGQRVLFVKLDVTDDARREQAGYLAHALGLGGLYNQHAGKTGFVLLVDAKTGNAVGQLTNAQSAAEMQAAIQQALR